MQYVMHIESLLHRNIFSLSGGEKQTLATAGVYVSDPDIYTLDEPTANLDLGITHMERSKELTQLGIITIGVSIVTEIVAAIVYEIMSYILVSTGSLEISNWGSVGIGIAFIIVSLICRYGAKSGREQ